MITCPHCQNAENQVKVGFNPSGSQRYLCPTCHRKYTPVPNEADHKESVRQQAVKMYLDGINQRRIARQLGVSQGSVSNWARAYARQLPPAVSQPEIPVDVAELDELFTLSVRKNKVYIMTIVDRASRCFLS